jgi:hypothetical protein
VPANRLRAGIESIRAELRSQLDHAPTHLNRGRDRRRLRAPRARLERVEAALPVTGEQALQMPARDPDSAAAAVTVSCLDTTWRTATRARDMRATVRPPPDGRAAGRRGVVARRAPPPRRPAGPAVTYVPTHERRITWDICPEPRHPRSPLRKRPVSTATCKRLSAAIPRGLYAERACRRRGGGRRGGARRRHPAS